MPLRDLEAQTDLDISSEHLAIAGALYYAYQLEEIRLFQVIDRIVDLFRQGLVPLGRGGATDTLEQLARRSRSAAEGVRRNAYWRIFGLARGEPPQGEPNSEFRSLWTHFIVTVADRIGADPSPSSAADGDAQVRAAARAVARNLSKHARAAARAAAEQVVADVQQAMDIVGDRDIQRAFGARSAWQVIARVNASHLGAEVDLARFRIQANAAKRIFDRLARLDGPARDDGELIDAVEDWINANANVAERDAVSQ